MLKQQKPYQLDQLYQLDLLIWFEEVYHLKGGILKYLEEVPQGESLWDGECFVFDDRVTVNDRLEKGSYDQCNACRLPITETDKGSEL